LKLLLKIRSRELNAAARLIARSDDLEALASGRDDDLQLMKGWRFEVFGKSALDLVEGRVGFAVRNGKLVMSEIEQSADSDK
jgi:ribonuclease D